MHFYALLILSAFVLYILNETTAVLKESISGYYSAFRSSDNKNMTEQKMDGVLSKSNFSEYYLCE